MSEMRLNIRFHDPNPAEDTYKLVSRVFAEVCTEKLRKKLLEPEKEKSEQSACDASAPKDTDL